MNVTAEQLAQALNQLNHYDSSQLEEAVALVFDAAYKTNAADSKRQRQRLRYGLYRDLAACAGITWGSEEFEIDGSEAHAMIKRLIPDPA